MKTPRIALIGAGFTIERVAAKLVPAETVIATRSEEKAARYRTLGFSAQQLDIANAAEVAQFFLRFSKLETLVDSVPPLSGDLRAGGTAHDGVRNIVEGARSAALKRLIYLSTTGVYGVDDGSIVDEEHPELPRGTRGKNRLEAEKIYEASGIPFCALRIAAIYGAGRGVGLALREARYPFIDEGLRWSNRIHVDDLAAAIVSAIEYPGTLPRALNAADDMPALTRDVVEHYCDRFGFARPASITHEDARARGLESLLSNQRVSNVLLKKTLNLTLRYPSFREGAGSEFEGEAPVREIKPRSR